jgi:hypothetical protein
MGQPRYVFHVRNRHTFRTKNLLDETEKHSSFHDHIGRIGRNDGEVYF